MKHVNHIYEIGRHEISMAIEPMVDTVIEGEKLIDHTVYCV